MKRIVAVTVAALLLAAAPVVASPVEDKRAEARRVASQLDALSRRLSILDEDFNEARLARDRTQVLLLDARAAKERADARVRAADERVRRQAVEAYVGSGSLEGLAALVEGPATELATRREYLAAAMGSTQRTLEDARRVREDAAVERARLETVADEARDAAAAVAQRREQAQATVREQRALLGRVEGELAELVRQEEARRAAEAARRARVELEARQARARAAAQAAAERSAAAEAAAARAREAARARAVPAPRPTDEPRADRSEREATADDIEPAGPAPPPASGAAAAVEEARAQLGKPYQWGASGPDSFDCSGLTSWAWRAGGVRLPHSSRAQYDATTRVGLSDVAPGDLLFYGRPIHHVGIYAGGGQMIEASETGTPVRYASIYRSDLVGVGRPG